MNIKQRINGERFKFSLETDRNQLTSEVAKHLAVSTPRSTMCLKH